jgi:hypothetical protein
MIVNATIPDLHVRGNPAPVSIRAVAVRVDGEKVPVDAEG